MAECVFQMSGLFVVMWSCEMEEKVGSRQGRDKSEIMNVLACCRMAAKMMRRKYCPVPANGTSCWIVERSM